MRILLAENDKALNFKIRYHLEKENFKVDSCLNAKEVVYYIQQNIHDLILLDTMISGEDTSNLLKQLEKSKDIVPVIPITSTLMKPFEFEDLMTRIYLMTEYQNSADQEKKLILGDIRYYSEEYRLQGKEKSCILSKKEGALLELFLHSPNILLSRNFIIDTVWDYDSDITDGNLDNYIYFIRRCLKNVTDLVSIITIRGIGYKITAKS